jgi:hypothetical protein
MFEVSGLPLYAIRKEATFPLGGFAHSLATGALLGRCQPHALLGGRPRLI